MLTSVFRQILKLIYAVTLVLPVNYAKLFCRWSL